MNPFSIKVSISIEPDDVRQEIESIFVQTFAPEIGDDESPAEFMQRKVEAYILNIFCVQKAAGDAETLRQSLMTDINTSATIRQRKDKPKPEPEPA